MNKKELIKKYEYLNHDCFRRVDTSEVLKDLKQLYEPQKVVVPQFVADYIEFQKKNNFHVYGAMRVIEDHYDKRVPEWFYEKNIEKFVLAWIFGYEVGKEKRYRVKIKGKIKENLLVYGLGIGRYFFAITYDITKRGEHTRKQLEEAGFGWVFDCEGIEIEEVEE